MTLGRRFSIKAKCTAFTKVELAVVLALLVALVLLLAPVWMGHKVKASRTTCVNNLKNIGLACRIFATDNEGRYPWALSVTNGGSQEFLSTPWSPLPHFLALSNGLSTAKILACPTDSARQPAYPFSALTGTNLSYFLGVEATEGQPRSILSGDRNLTWNGVELKPGLAVLTTDGTVGFGSGIHGGGGNLLLVDGSVNQGLSPVINSWFRRALADTGTNTMRLLVP